MTCPCCGAAFVKEWHNKLGDFYQLFECGAKYALNAKRTFAWAELCQPESQQEPNHVQS